MTKPQVKILSFDIDLNGIAAWSNVVGTVASGASDVLPCTAILEHDLVLIEVASPMFYAGVKDKGRLTNTFKWAIYNSMVAGKIYMFVNHNGYALPTILVAPSNLWTLGYNEEMRHAIASVSGDNHDIRECRCMQFFYQSNSEKWTTFEKYFAGLSTRRKS